MGTQQVGQRRAAHPVCHGVLGGKSHQPVDGHHLGQQPCALIQSRLARNRIQLQAPPHLVTDIDGAGLSCLLDFDLIEDHAHRFGLERGCGVNIKPMRAAPPKNWHLLPVAPEHFRVFLIHTQKAIALPNLSSISPSSRSSSSPRFPAPLHLAALLKRPLSVASEPYEKRPAPFRTEFCKSLSGQQLALEAVEVVGGCGADMTFPVDGNPALDHASASFGLRVASSVPRATQSCGVSPVCPASATYAAMFLCADRSRAIRRSTVCRRNRIALPRRWPRSAPESASGMPSAPLCRTPPRRPSRFDSRMRKDHRRSRQAA